METFLITFPSTTAAMRATKALKTAGIVHQVLPVPKAISAGCGMSVRLEADNAEAAVRILDQCGLEAGQCSLYRQLAPDSYEPLAL